MKCFSIRKKSDKLMEDVRGFWDGIPAGYKISEDTYARLVNELARRIKAEPYTVYQSGISMINKPWTEPNIRFLCYFMTANSSDLAKRIIVPYGGTRVADGNVEVQFYKVEYVDSNRLKLRMKVLTGPLACCWWTVTVTLPQAYSWISKLGYTTKPGTPYTCPSLSLSFPGLYGVLKVNTDGGRHNSATSAELDITESSSAKTYNRNNIILFRSGYSLCPFGYAERVDRLSNYCTLRCLHSFEKCPASGHSEEYKTGFCPKCGQPNRPMSSHYPEKCMLCVRNASGLTEYD